MSALYEGIVGAVPFPTAFEFNQYVTETRLSDETETGGLFGFRFD